MKKSIIATMFFACTALLPAYSSTVLPPSKLIVTNRIVNQNTILLHLANLEKKYTYVTITNMRGDLVYFSEGVKNHNGFHRAVNLKNLNSGRYMVKIKVDDAIIKQVLSIDGSNAYLSSAKLIEKKT